MTKVIMLKFPDGKFWLFTSAQPLHHVVSRWMGGVERKQNQGKTGSRILGDEVFAELCKTVKEGKKFELKIVDEFEDENQAKELKKFLIKKYIKDKRMLNVSAEKIEKGTRKTKYSKFYFITTKETKQ